MAKTMLGVFTNQTNVEDAIEELKTEGFNPKDISIVMRDTTQAHEIEKSTGTTVTEGAVAGVTTGSLLGGLAGLLAAVAIPGLGAFFIGGPIAAALGLTGAAASTVSGAVTGALAGGLIGALTNLGLSEEDARYYEGRVKEGAILIAVPVRNRDEAFVQEIFEDFDAQDIKVISTQDESVRDRYIDEETYTARGTLGGSTNRSRRRRRAE